MGKNLYMIMLLRGGYIYVGILHEGLPIGQEINKNVYNVFILKKRDDDGGRYEYNYEYRVSKDLLD